MHLKSSFLSFSLQITHSIEQIKRIRKTNELNEQINMSNPHLYSF